MWLLGGRSIEISRWPCLSRRERKRGLEGDKEREQGRKRKGIGEGERGREKAAGGVAGALLGLGRG